MISTRASCIGTGLLILLIRASAAGQQVPAAITTDPPPDHENPATMESPDILSHGSKMYAVVYIASGAGPHPTVVMMHGFPGNEKNFDLAYSIRRAGWNVLVPFYRGAWGSSGAFSFTHAIEDTQAAVEFLRTPENAKRFRVDTNRIVLVGHSMGGFIVASATAHDPRICGVALISAANLGPSSAKQRAGNSKEFHERWRANASRLAGTTAEALLEEVIRSPEKWDYMNFVSLLKDRPVLIVEADDRNTADNQALAQALRKAGNTKVTETHMATDHPFSDHRIALQAEVVNWLTRILQ
jgi:uncharacterized protein